MSRKDTYPAEWKRRALDAEKQIVEIIHAYHVHGDGASRELAKEILEAWELIKDVQGSEPDDR